MSLSIAGAVGSALANVVLVGVATVLSGVAVALAYAVGRHVRAEQCDASGCAVGKEPGAADPSATPVRQVFPNDDVAAAVDALARQVPAETPVDLLTLGSDTIRAALAGRGRAMDITRPRRAERCHVTIHSLEPHPRRRLWGPRAAPDPYVTHHHDVDVDQLSRLLAQPLPGSTTQLFTPRPAPPPPAGQQGAP